MAAADVTHLLKSLADPTRLRILALVEGRELAVGELAAALSMSQSRISNHLRLLRETGLLAERRSGTSTFVQLAPDRGGALQDSLWTAIHASIDSLAGHRKDLLRLERLLEDRERKAAQLFDDIAPDWDKIGLDFESGQARQRVAASLLPRGLVIADIGCGTGYLARGLAGLVGRIICIDRSKAMLAEAKKRFASERPDASVEFRRGELDRLPLEDGELDGLVAGMVLHHLSDLAPALAEMRRVLKPGAGLAILELEPHAEDWMRDEMGDRHLGLDPEHVVRALTRAGFEAVRSEPLDDHYTPRSRAPKHTAARLSLYLVRAFAPSRP